METRRGPFQLQLLDLGVRFSFWGFRVYGRFGGLGFRVSGLGFRAFLLRVAVRRLRDLDFTVRLLLLVANIAVSGLKP